MNRGSTGRSERHLRHQQASMRPRFMNRGSGESLCLHSDVLESFNEAPIHESGKYVRSGFEKRTGPGFNEAPIHESGKCRRYGRLVREVVVVLQ